MGGRRGVVFATPGRASDQQRRIPLGVPSWGGRGWSAWAAHGGSPLERARVRDGDGDRFRVGPPFDPRRCRDRGVVVLKIGVAGAVGTLLCVARPRRRGGIAFLGGRLGRRPLCRSSVSMRGRLRLVARGALARPGVSMESLASTGRIGGIGGIGGFRGVTGEGARRACRAGEGEGEEQIRGKESRKHRVQG